MIYKYEINLEQIRKFTHIIGNIVKNNAVKVEISENNGVWESTLKSSIANNDITLYITPFVVDFKIDLGNIKKDDNVKYKLNAAKNKIQDYWFAFMYKIYGERYENDYYNYWCGYNRCVCDDIQEEETIENPNNVYNKMNNKLEQQLQKIKETNPILVEDERK